MAQNGNTTNFSTTTVLYKCYKGNELFFTDNALNCTHATPVHIRKTPVVNMASRITSEKDTALNINIQQGVIQNKINKEYRGIRFYENKIKAIRDSVRSCANYTFQQYPTRRPHSVIPDIPIHSPIIHNDSNRLQPAHNYYHGHQFIRQYSYGYCRSSQILLKKYQYLITDKQFKIKQYQKDLDRLVK